MPVKELTAVQSAAEFRIKVDGRELPRTVNLLSVHVSKLVNKVAYAKIVIQDGNPASGEFPVSDSDLFVPGNEIEISAGSTEDQQEIFKGIIIKHGLRLMSDAAPRLIIECKHKAVRLTVGRKSGAYYQVSDSDVTERLLSGAGFGAGELELEPTSVIHDEVIQYHVTDWDFIVSRAEVNSQVILTNDGKIKVVKPDYGSPVVLSLQYGSGIIELEAEIDGRYQFQQVKSYTWDPANQEPSEQEATEPGLEEQGNLDSATLAQTVGLETFRLHHGGALKAGEMKAWADAQLLKSRMAKIRGRVKFDGIAGLNPGDFIDLSRIGNRFNGKAFISGVRQDFNAVSGWKTQAQFGLSPNWFAVENDLTERKAGGIIPGAIGLHSAIVVDNEDPEGEFKVKVKLPFIDPEDEGIWARIALPDAGNSRGLFFRPEINDEVVIGFMYDDPRQPVVLGMLHSSHHEAPLSPSNENHQKGYTSREGLRLLFDDEHKEISIETPGGNKVLISDGSEKLYMEDQHGNKITMDDQGIKLSSAQKIELEAGSEIVLGGVSIKVSAEGGLELNGSGNAKLESNGMLTIKGSLVQIN